MSPSSAVRHAERTAGPSNSTRARVRVAVSNLGQGLSLYVHSAVRMRFWLNVVLRIITAADFNVFHRSRYWHGVNSLSRHEDWMIYIYMLR